MSDKHWSELAAGEAFAWIGMEPSNEAVQNLADAIRTALAEAGYTVEQTKLHTQKIEALKKAKTCGLDSSVKALVDAALAPPARKET